MTYPAQMLPIRYLVFFPVLWVLFIGYLLKIPLGLLGLFVSCLSCFFPVLVPLLDYSLYVRAGPVLPNPKFQTTAQISYWLVSAVEFVVRFQS